MKGFSAHRDKGRRNSRCVKDKGDVKDEVYREDEVVENRRVIIGDLGGKMEVGKPNLSKKRRGNLQADHNLTKMETKKTISKRLANLNKL